MLRLPLEAVTPSRASPLVTIYLPPLFSAPQHWTAAWKDTQGQHRVQRGDPSTPDLRRCWLSGDEDDERVDIRGKKALEQLRRPVSRASGWGLSMGSRNPSPALCGLHAVLDGMRVVLSPPVEVQ